MRTAVETNSTSPRHIRNTNNSVLSPSESLLSPMQTSASESDPIDPFGQHHITDDHHGGDGGDQLAANDQRVGDRGALDQRHPDFDAKSVLSQSTDTLQLVCSPADEFDFDDLDEFLS